MLHSNPVTQELDNKGYVCLQCKASYSPLDVDRLMSFELGMFLCDICKGEVVDNENTESVLGSKDRMQRFNHQMRFVRAGLQKSEAMVLPAYALLHVHSSMNLTLVLWQIRRSSLGESASDGS